MESGNCSAEEPAKIRHTFAVRTLRKDRRLKPTLQAEAYATRFLIILSVQCFVTWFLVCLAL
jgi:hypothetical protein